MSQDNPNRIPDKKNYFNWKVAIPAVPLITILFLLRNCPRTESEKPVEIINNNFTEPYIYPKDSGLITPENIQTVLITDNKDGWANANILNKDTSEKYQQNLAPRKPEAASKLSRLLSENPTAVLAFSAAHIFKKQLKDYPELLPADTDFPVMIVVIKKPDSTYQTLAVIEKLSFPKTDDNSTVVLRGIDKQSGPDKCININNSTPDVKPREFQATKSSNQFKNIPNVTLYTAAQVSSSSPRGLSGMPAFTVGNKQPVGTFTGIIPRDAQGKELTQQDCVAPSDIATTDLVVAH